MGQSSKTKFQVVLILLCTIYKSHADHHSKGFLKSTLNQYYTIGENKNAVTLSWDMIMAHMSCCGVDGYEDFRTAKLFVQKSSAEGLGRQVDIANLSYLEPTLTTYPTNNKLFSHFYRHAGDQSDKAM